MRMGQNGWMKFTACSPLLYTRLHLSILSTLLCVSASAQVDVLTQHNDNARTGANLQETLLTPANVNKSQFGMLFKRVVDDQVYTQPLVVTGVEVNGGTHDLVIITTVNNSVYAFDANDPEATAPIWHVNFGTPANVHSANFGCTDMNGAIGIIGTPVIDKQRGVVYVVALTKAGAPAMGVDAPLGTGFAQRLHELDLATGADMPESPVTIKADSFNPLMQNQRPGLMLANGMVYLGYASHCDREPYHGFLLAYDAQTLQQVAAFNASPTGTEAGIWQTGQGPAADADGNVYVGTGNGSWNGVDNFSESVLKFTPKLKLLDWFTPTNHEALDQTDTDMNSGGVTLVPGTHLLLTGGKEGVLYTLDTRNLGQLGDEHAVEHFQATASHLHSLVYWQSAKAGRLLYVWGQRDQAKVYKFDGDKLIETPVAMLDTPNEGHPGAMLSLSANGAHDGILWAAIHATGDSWHESRPGILHAYDADNIRRELWNSLELPARDDCAEYSKMAPPTIANGHVYLASFGTENIGTGQFCAYGLLPTQNAAKPAAPLGVSAQQQGRSDVTLTWAAVPGASFYRVDRTSTHVANPRIESGTVATGLTTPRYLGPPPDRGESATYTVYAVGPNGVSAASTSVTVGVARPIPPEE